MVSKSESKALIEAYAKTSGKPAEEIVAEIAQTFGYTKANIPIPTNGDGEEKLSPMMRAIIEAKKMEGEMGAAGKGEVSPMIKMMMETVTMMPLMKMMGGMGQESTAQKPQENIMELLAKNDEKWERRLEKMEKEQKETALQKQLDDLKALIQNSSGTKKDELSDKFEKLSEKLDTEKTERFKDALEAQKTEMSQFREDVREAMDSLKTQNQTQPKDPTEAFFEMMQKMETFDNTVRRRGKALGMSDEQVDREISSTKPAWQQMLADITGEKGLLAKYIGMQKGGIVEAQPEIAQPEVAQPLTCGNCHGLSNNGSDWCDPCRIQYSNDVVAEQQRKAAEAQKAPAQQTEAEARAKGEIPAEIQSEEAQQV